MVGVLWTIDELLVGGKTSQIIFSSKNGTFLKPLTVVLYDVDVVKKDLQFGGCNHTCSLF